ncbi:MAG: hypothetical protein EAX86_04875 [Candidatus Heimdallarchaeota archaeon]|nr:hypothetical protein [Candidatus Heimdallarchaeota archaeon]
MEIPLMTPFGWGTAAFIFIFSFKLIDQRIERNQNKILIFLGLIIPLIGVHFTIIFVLRTAFVALGNLGILL